MCFFGRKKSAPPPPPPPPAPVPPPPPPPAPPPVTGVTTNAQGVTTNAQGVTTGTGSSGGRPVTPTVKAARKAEKKALALKKGRKSTILTSPRGVLTEANIKKKTLLGA